MRLARILNGVSVGCLLLGIFVLSPTGSFIFGAMAMLSAIAPAVTGPKSVRMIGVVLLVLSIGLVALRFQSFMGEQERYRDLSIERASKRQTPSQSPSQQSK